MTLSRTLEKRSKIYGDGGTADLFGKPELPDGFHYLPDVLSPAEENAFVRQFEKLPLKPFEFHGYLGNRRIYSFGHRYIFAGQEPRADPSIPDYLRPLTEIANQISGMPAEAFEQLMVTEYAPGAGIGWHRDRPTFDAIVIYRDGHFTRVDRDGALKALHDDLQRALSDDEVERRKLSKALLPHVKEFYGNYVDPARHEPFYRQSSRV
jgi:hypothetical protein